eukprot:Colp12_sorted_trinity150504_noHs@20663
MSAPATSAVEVPHTKMASDKSTVQVVVKTNSEPIWMKYLIGGLSGMTAAVVTHPLDLIKVRMQLIGKAAGSEAVKPGMWHTAKGVVTSQGFTGLYSGLSASLLRQMTYTTTRLGLYEQLKNSFQKGDKSSLGQSIFLAAIAGAGGAVIGNPADVTMVRMQADGRLPPSQRRNYTSALDGLARTVKAEGVGALFSGVLPNIERAMLMCVGQLAAYDQTKQLLLSTPYFSDSIATHILSSIAAGFVATSITSPFDVVKTRIMNASPTDPQYKGTLDAFTKILRAEGPFAFYKGWTPYFIRLGPNTVVMMVVCEQLKKLASSFSY